jgi:hypothetical protein
LSFNQIDIHRHGLVESPLDSIRRDLIKHDPKDGGFAGFFGLQLFFQMPADRFPFPVRVGREVDGIDALGGLLQFGDEFLFTLNYFVFGCKVTFNIDGEVLLREVLHMPQGSLYDELLT